MNKSVSKLTFLAIAASLAGAVPSNALAQDAAPGGAATPDAQGKFGFMTPKGAFVPLPNQSPETAAAVPPAAAVARSGTLNITVRFQVLSNIPSTNKINCSLSLNVRGSDQGVSDYVYQTTSRFATVNSGKGTCTFVLKYLWILNVPAVDTVNFYISLYGNDANNSSISLTPNQPPSIPLPAQGATTPVVINAGGL
ncbi:MAG TPA: hypothetical protein VFG05_13440 [Methylocella sp.]|nr:hypothetical protein [Methylocella sp.]